MLYMCVSLSYLPDLVVCVGLGPATRFKAHYILCGVFDFVVFSKIAFEFGLFLGDIVFFYELVCICLFRATLVPKCVYRLSDTQFRLCGRKAYNLEKHKSSLGFTGFLSVVFVYLNYVSWVTFHFILGPCY